jgi:hypothetical protein
MVASIWTLLGASVIFFIGEMPKDSPLHMRLRMLGLGFTLVGMGIYSVLVPVWFIQRDRKV